MENRNIAIKEFAEKAMRHIRLCMSIDYTIEITDVIKNNGIKRTALRIYDRQHNVVPVIYMDLYYELYRKGAALETICREIVWAYREGVQKARTDLAFMQDFDGVKSRVVCRLLNAEKNQELLEDTPHILLHDLAAAAYIFVSGDEAGENGMIRITDALLKEWNIDADTLFAHARENTRRLGAKTETLMQVLEEYIEYPDGKPDGELLAQAEEKQDFPVYVASNDKRLFGAAVMLDEGFLWDFADQIGDSFYILPSSIHELLFVAMEAAKPGDLRRMVQEVNQTQVAPEDILSDNVYLYNRQAGRVEMA